MSNTDLIFKNNEKCSTPNVDLDYTFYVEFNEEGIGVAHADQFGDMIYSLMPYCYLHSFEEVVQYVMAEEEMFCIGNTTVSDAVAAAKDEIVSFVNWLEVIYADICTLSLHFADDNETWHMEIAPRGVWMEVYDNDYDRDYTFYTKFCWLNGTSREDVFDLVDAYFDRLYDHDNYPAVVDYITKSLVTVQW